MTVLMPYLRAFAAGGLLCLIGQVLIDYTRLTPARILTSYVVMGVILGALGLYVSNGSVTDFQPMNINFGIIPPLRYRVRGKRNKNAELSRRSLEIIDALRGEVLSDIVE